MTTLLEMNWASEKGCPCFDVVMAGMPEQDEVLLLVPMDADADAALTAALDSCGFPYTRQGLALAVATSRRELGALSVVLTLIPRTLHTRIKGVFAGGADSPKGMLSAFLHAESLPMFLEHAEVAWVMQALRDDWLFSVFHPILDARTGDRFGYEALIRARNPETDEILPAGQLIYACSVLNLQHQLDRQARISAIRDAATLSRDGGRFFINFLPGAIYDPALSLTTTIEAAEQHGLEISQLVFEVVETEEIESTERLRRILDYYRQRGAGIALDDIGSGFSSLQYLAELEPDYVKVDREISAGAASSSSARHTLDSIVSLAKKLNTRVVAEGIETEAQLKACLEAGVDYVQGFLFALPANPPQPIRQDVFQHILRAA